VVVVLAAAMVAALVGLTVLGRVVRSPPMALTAALIVLPYLYAGLAAALFAVWAALPDRRLPPLFLGALVVLAGILWGPSLPAWPEEAAGLPLRVVSWNVRRLWGLARGPERPAACVEETLQQLDPHVLSLQEVTRQDVDLLARSLDLTCVHTDYLGTGDPTAGGLAACVDRSGPWRLHSGTAARFIPAHRWHYAFAEVERQGRIVNLLAVHLQPYRLAADGLGRAATVSARQGDQSAELLRRVGRFRDPTILAGDFNSTRDAALHVGLRRTLVDTFEQGGRGLGPTVHLLGWLPIRIDYIYVTPSLAVRETRVVPRDCSDHRAVVSDLVLRAE